MVLDGPCGVKEEIVSKEEREGRQGSQANILLNLEGEDSDRQG